MHETIPQTTLVVVCYACCGVRGRGQGHRLADRPRRRRRDRPDLLLRRRPGRRDRPPGPQAPRGRRDALRVRARRARGAAAGRRLPRRRRRGDQGARSGPRRSPSGSPSCGRRCTAAGTPPASATRSASAASTSSRCGARPRTGSRPTAAASRFRTARPGGIEGRPSVVAVIVIAVIVYLAFHLGAGHAHYRHARAHGLASNFYWSSVRGPYLTFIKVAGALTP